ncbi:ABC transporter substrate-binding protein [Acetobacterium wieringae]|uniref:ABC transporter substrate-binding protein n=1 Tax=Acetobacterium wieringae TaxID=52694 RepID=UPI0026F26405|nr:ABC transporter substrate-binding protein [Acetobacterium wieringae]
MKKQRMILAVLTILMIGGLLGAGCTGKTEENGKLSVDVVYPFSEDYSQSFKNGIELAAQEINDQGGILNQSIEVNYNDDGNNINTAVEVATRIAENSDFPIVIGHRSTDDVLKVGSIYHQNNKLLFAPIIASSKLNLAQNPGAYLCAPSDDAMASELVGSIAAQGISRIAVVHSAGNTYGKDFIQKVEEHANATGIEIVDAVSYLPNLDYFRYYVKKWDSMGAQAIVSACVGNDITALYEYLEKTGNTRPIFASYDIEIQAYTIPQSMKNLIQVTSYFNNTATTGAEAAFIQAYQQAYGLTPDLPAAQAYMAMHLAADAANQAQSLKIEAIRKVLEENSFETVYGGLSFNKRLITGIPVFQKIYLNDQLVPKNNITGGGNSGE